jgi:hypothetical protein
LQNDSIQQSIKNETPFWVTFPSVQPSIHPLSSKYESLSSKYTPRTFILKKIE